MWGLENESLETVSMKEERKYKIRTRFDGRDVCEIDTVLGHIVQAFALSTFPD